MASIILLFLCLLIGVFFQKVKAFPSNTHQVLNQFIIHVSLPAMALHYLPKIHLDSSLVYPVMMPWISIGLSFLLFFSLGKYFKWSKSLTGCLIITAGFGNTSFVGIPVIQALFGEAGLETLIMVDLPGTFVALSTVGIVIATLFSNGQASAKNIFKKVVSFPPFIVFILGMLMNVLDLKFHENVDSVLKTLSLTISPIALVSVGYQLRINRRSKHWKFLILGLSYQLLFFPAIIYLLYKIILRQEGLMIDVCVMESAMAPMITACIVAAQYGLKPRLSAMMVGIGIPVSFITLAFWYWVI